MPSSSQVLDEARSLLKNRLAELDDERKRLERALSELGGKVSGKAGAARRGRPAKRAASSTGKRRRGRRNTRSSQAVKLVQKSPGTSAAEIAKAMKIKPNYLYRVLGELEKTGQVKKKGRQYFPGG